MMCKFNQDGICVNADCPYVADYCPVIEDDKICIHNPINGSLVKLPCINKVFGKYCVVFMNKYNDEEFIDRFSFKTLTQAKKKLKELKGGKQ